MIVLAVEWEDERSGERLRERDIQRERRAEKGR